MLHTTIAANLTFDKSLMMNMVNSFYIWNEYLVNPYTQ